MNSGYYNDSLNLRDLIEQTSDFARSNNCEPRNARSFFQILFCGITASDLGVTKKRITRDGVSAESVSVNVKEDPLLLFLQKLLSGNVPVDSLASLSASIVDGKLTNKLKANLSPIIEAISAIPDCFSFFLRLSQQISPRFFGSEEIHGLKTSLYNSDYCQFYFDLVLHSFRTLYNIPAYFCERLLDEALTYDYDSPVRYELMRIAAGSNKRAALEYGNYLAKKGPYSEAFEYMMNALPMPSAIWNIAYLIEKHLLLPEDVKRFKTAIRYDERILEDTAKLLPEITAIICVEKVPIYDDLVCAFRVYSFLASKCNFFKGYNSMAKLLNSKSFMIMPGSTYNKDALVQEYFRRAILGGNPTAMNNVGAILLDRIENGSISENDVYEQELLRACLENASDCGLANATYKLARYMEYHLKESPDRIIDAYQRSIQLDVDNTKVHGLALISLGNLERDPAKKRTFYQQALDFGEMSAVVYLATEFNVEMRQSDNPDYWLFEMQSLLIRNKVRMEKSQIQKLETLISDAECWCASKTGKFQSTT